MKIVKANLTEQFISDIRTIILSARESAIRSVDTVRVQMYWKLGERIFIEEQKGQDRAEYGAYLLQNVALEIEKEFGSGFSVRQLERARQFYRTYPIATALRTQLNWYQYRLLIQIDDKDKREYYELEATNNNWTGRELERQINSGLYERLLLSNDKKAVLEHPAVKEVIEQVKEDLGSDGRILVRESGTEPLLRVMVEATTQELCKEYVGKVIETMKSIM